jgi:hypothetical protein
MWKKWAPPHGNRRLNSAQTPNRTQSSNGLVATKKIPHPEKKKPPKNQLEQEKQLNKIIKN